MNIDYNDKINTSILQTEKLIALKVAENTKMIQATARANYSAHTKNGKARFVDTLIQSIGTQKDVSEFLGLSEGRISQLVKLAKKNGK